jgi:hypothetical protein
VKRKIICRDWQSTHKALVELSSALKGWLISGGGALEISVKPLTRSEEENRMLHALIADIARQKDWAGAKRDAETWKRLLVAAWCRTRGESVEVLPALDGHGIDMVPARTSKLTRGECADLIEFVQAWCAMNDVRLSASESMKDDR